MARKKHQKTEVPKVEAQPVLTEWQKRHLEFEERRRKRQEEEAVLGKDLPEQDQDVLESDEDREGTDHESLDDLVQQENLTGEEEGEAVLSLPPFKPHPGLPKALPILLMALIVLMLSALMISPLSKKKVLTVTGAVNTTSEAVLSATNIQDSDYITTVWWGSSRYEKNVLANNPWVKSAKLTYHFPNQFTLAIEEYPVVAYNLTAEGYRPILETGQQVEAVGDGQLPPGVLPLQFEKAEDTASFIKQFVGLDPVVRGSIQEVSFANSASTPDLLLLTMTEGHTVRVPLSELGLKLPYYKTIKDKLGYPQIIDMEVGIYTTTSDLETMASETKASKEREAKELEALTNSSTSSSDGASANTRTQTETSSSSGR